jgi:hypothetical protein
MGDEVYLMNPRAIKQKVALGNISGLGGVDQFHFTPIPPTWYKIDVKEVLQPKQRLMVENQDADQLVMLDVKGGNCIWDQQYLQHST